MLCLLLLCLGVCGVVAGCILLLCGVLTFNINEAEWGNITRTGLPSHPDALTWYFWKKNDGSVQPWRSFHPLEQPQVLPEYRIARGHTLVFDYTFYQGRYEMDGITKEFPALGSSSGASYHPMWAFLAFLIGIGSFTVRSRSTTPYAKALSTVASQ